MRFPVLSKSKALAIIVAMVCVALASSGILFYLYNKNQTPTEYTQASTSGLIKDFTQDVKRPDTTTPPTTTHQEDASAQRLPKPQSERTTSASSVSKNCVTAWNVPYKHKFVSGTGPISLGSKGLSETCTYNDGRPSETSTLLPPIDQVNYMNISTTDYETAAKICNDYPENYFGACMQVIWHS